MIKKSKGITAVDISIAVVAIIIFTSVILSLMANVKIADTQIRRKAIANIYLTEILENIGRVEYSQVTETEVFPTNMPSIYTPTLTVTNMNKEEDLVKKVEVKISYTINGKTYEQVAQRLKVKE